MNKWITKGSVAIVCVVCCFVAVAIAEQGTAESEIEKAAVLARTGKLEEAEKILTSMLAQPATATQAGYELGLIYYERNEPDKAVKFFKDALTAAFPQPPSGNVQLAVDIAKSGKTEEAEKMLITLIDDKDAAARASYELGLIYSNTGKSDKAVTMFRHALTTISNKGASSYVGHKTCKTCHLKQQKSWQNTKMAKAFETLKPGVDVEIKKKFNLDPQKDYTTDPKCLECHTNGFGMPGGYRIVTEASDTKATIFAKENENVTCESCHGPGSKFIAIHKNAMTKQQKYTLQSLYDAGQHKVNVKTCTVCHNSRNPTSGPDYKFDYEASKAKDTHEHFPLKYRQ